MSETPQGQGAAAAAAKGPEFGLQRIYVKDLSFEAPHAPKVFTERGSGIWSKTLLIIGTIFLVTVPATITQSACLGEPLKIIPNLSKS